MAVAIINSIVPNSGKIGEYFPTDALISGDHFVGTTDVSLGADITVFDIFVNGETEIYFSFLIDPGAALGLRTVVVTKPEGDGFGVDLFTVIDLAVPIPTSIAPDAMPQGTVDEWVQLWGSNLTGVTDVDFGAGITVSYVSVVTDTYAEVLITIDPAAVLGLRTITVTNPKGDGVLIDGFEVIPPDPTVSSVVPGYGDVGTSMTDIVIMGTGFSLATAVSFGAGDIVVDDFRIISDTEIHADITIPIDESLGLIDVEVWTDYAGGVLTEGFDVWPFANIIDSWSSCTVVATSEDTAASSGGFIGATWDGIIPS